MVKHRSREPGRLRQWLRAFHEPAEAVDLSPIVADETKTTTCYMCACRCGIKVHLRGGQIRFIEGNRDHPVNHGVLCAKGSAGIMTQYSPARLTQPLLRVGPRGAGEFRPISWDEALGLAAEWLRKIRERNPRELAFFTGRDQSQSFTGWWAKQFGTPNFAAHGGFCSVNMAAAGLYTLGGSFWEFGEPDWERARFLLMFGVAEDHDSNPIKLGIARLRQRSAKFVSINPVRTGYSAVADEWIGIRPGTDGLLVLALVHELLRTDRIDLDFLARYTNACWLVIDNPGSPDHGLFARDSDGQVLAWDRRGGTAIDAASPDLQPAIVGTYQLADSRPVRPVFHLVAERYLDGQYAPEAVADRTGVAPATIRRLAAELATAAFDHAITLEQPWTDCAGRRHATMIGRPVAMHAMRGISAHANGFHTCRAIHLLQLLLGAVDTPGSWRHKSPYPKAIPPGPAPVGRGAKPNTMLEGMALGYPQGPQDLLIEHEGTPIRIDRAFSWDAPLAAHGMMHTVLANAAAGDPYPIDTLFLYMANMAWNSAMNPGDAMRAMTATNPDTSEYRIPHIIYADAFYSETVAYADLVLPDTTYLERWDCISLLDRPIGAADGPADAIRQPVLPPDRDVRPFQDVMLDLGARLQLPGFVDNQGGPRYRDYADYMTNHERSPGIGPLAGWRGNGEEAGRGAPNPNQLDRYVEHGCFWQHELALEQRFYKFANRAYLETAHQMGLASDTAPIVMQLYSEPLQRFRLAAEGHGEVQPPEAHRARIRRFFDPLPIWYPPLEPVPSEAAFPLHAITQRPMPMYHSWGSHNAWLRQILGRNQLYMNRATGEALGFTDDDLVWVISARGRVKARLKLMEGVNPDTVWTWNAVGKRAGAWNLAADAPEAHQGFLLNHLIAEFLPEEAGSRFSNSDPITGQAAWYDLRVRVERVLTEEAQEEPFAPLPLPRAPGAARPPRVLRFNAGVGS